MGNVASSLGSALLGAAFPMLSKPDDPSTAPEEFVIVPPMITTDRQEINRMAFSSYDWAHRKRELTVLLTEYLQPGAVARLNIVPPSNDRILSSVNLAAPDLLSKGWRHVLSEQNGGAGALQTHADLTVRAHLTPGDPHSFVAFVAGANQGFLSPGVHFAAVPAGGAGPGFFGSLPLVANAPAKAAQAAQLGVRYAAPAASLGLTATPAATTIDKAWALLRHSPAAAPDTHLTFGAQLEPRLCVRDALQNGLPRGALRAEHVSTFVEYQSGAPDSYFSVLVEAERARTLRFSVLQHLARMRRIYNLFEDDDVVGITNYLDFGISVAAPVAARDMSRTTFEAAAAWQVNSNLLVKAALSSARVCAAFVAKSWWEPCFSLSAMAGWDFDRNEPCAGLSLHVDNDADLRYERGLHTAQTGSLVRQKHAATVAEGKVAQGARLVVRGGEAARDASDELLLVPPRVTHRRSDLL